MNTPPPHLCVTTRNGNTLTEVKKKKKKKIIQNVSSSNCGIFSVLFRFIVVTKRSKLE